MNTKEMIKEIERLVANGKKSLTINSIGRDDSRYSAHLIVMATDPINGTLSVFKDGKYFMDKSFKDFLPVYEQYMTQISDVLMGDKRQEGEM